MELQRVWKGKVGDRLFVSSLDDKDKLEEIADPMVSLVDKNKDRVDPGKVWSIETKIPLVSNWKAEVQSDINTAPHQCTDEILIGLPKKVMTASKLEGGRVHYKGSYIDGRKLNWTLCEVRTGMASSQTRMLINSVEVDKKGNLVLEEKQVQCRGIEVTYTVLAQRE